MKMYNTLRDFYQDYGWNKYQYYNKNGRTACMTEADSCCLVGAYRLIANLYCEKSVPLKLCIETNLRQQMTARIIPNRLTYFEAIPEFNDNLSSKEQMLSIFGDVSIKDAIEAARKECS